MRQLIILAVFLVVAAPSLGATPAAKTYPYRLSAQDTQAVANLACESRHGVKHSKLEASADAPANVRLVNARVECIVHQHNSDYSVQHVATCKRTTNWQCDGSELAIRAKLGKHPITIYSASHDADTAYTLVKKLAAYRNRNGDPVLSANVNRCTVANGPFKEMVDVTCDERLYRLSYFCPQSSCPRIYAVGGMYIPPNEGGL